MAKRTKSVKDEELVEEEVVQESSSEEGGRKVNTEGFFQKYKNWMLGGLAAILAIVVVYRFFFEDKSSNQNSVMEANELMVWPIRYMEMDSLDKAIYGDGQNYGFSDIAKKYKGSKAGNVANYGLAVCWIKLGDLDQGMTNLKKVKKGDNMLSASTYSMMGFVYEEKQQFKDAANYYEKASKTPAENPFTTPFFLMEAARCYESAGDAKAAVAVYERIKQEFPESEEGGQVEKYLAKLN